ncbi:MAG: site-specific DNA-methyltransferase [Gammaproteobacteria bacterium]|nr:site-specific DNA-methyltransferase [Gammaproteobacteria bacterium]
MSVNPKAPARPRAYVLDNSVWSSLDGHSSLTCADQQPFMAGVAAESVDCIWTDPPYFLSNNGTTCVAGRRQSVNKGQWDKSQGITDDHAFNRAWLEECWRVLKPAGTVWVSGTLHVYLSVGMALRELGFRILNDIVWEKPNPPPNLGCRCFTHATEMLLWATKAPQGSRHRHVFNYAAMKHANGNRQMKNVWQFKASGAAEKQYGRHPTQKPLALIERCLLASTQVGDQVLDLFAGSGSTGVAALRLGRRFRGCEIEPKYVEIAARRLAAAEVEGSTS